jgi:DNA replication protein DnaC
MTDLKEIAKKLGFKAMLENWDEYGKEPLVKKILEAEELDQNRRSLEKRLRASHVQELKPVSDFDWNWPKVIDRELVEELFTLKFLAESLNVVFVGPNGVGKSMLSKNLIYAALLAGKKTKFTSASQMLADLSAQDGATARKRCLLKYTSPHLLAIDELGYLSYDNRYADLLYEVLNARYLKTSTIITTNKAFVEWGEIFPNAGCVVTLVDRLIHKSEIVKIEGDSYRKKEALERAQLRAQQKRPKDKHKEEDN